MKVVIFVFALCAVVLGTVFYGRRHSDTIAKRISSSYSSWRLRLPLSVPQRNTPELDLDLYYTPKGTKNVVPSSGSSSPTVKENTATVNVGNATSPYINPGCIERRLGKFRTWNSDKVYLHPPIIHYVKLTNGGGSVELSLRDYMAMMSAYKFLRPEKIFIHSNAKVVGKYFDRAQKWNGTLVVGNKVERKTTLSGKRVAFIQISADYVKISQLFEHGGLVSDFDVIIINGTRLLQEQTNSECVIAQEGDIPNIGIVSCIKNSPFVGRWLEHYHNDYHPESWLHNSAFVPMDILLKDKSTCYNVHLEPTMCVHPNAKEAQTDWLKKNGVPHWRTKTAAHYYLRSKSIPNDNKLLHGDSSLSEMMRYVDEYKV